MTLKCVPASIVAIAVSVGGGASADEPRRETSSPSRVRDSHGNANRGAENRGGDARGTHVATDRDDQATPPTPAERKTEKADRKADERAAKRTNEDE